MAYTPGHYALEYWDTEVEEAEERRERYNIRKASEIASKGTSSAFERMSFSAEAHYRNSNIDNTIATRRVRRQTKYFMPTVAGTVELMFHHFAGTSRSSQLWEVCRQALADGVYEEMARDMGLKARRSMLERLKPMIQQADIDLSA